MFFTVFVLFLGGLPPKPGIVTESVTKTTFTTTTVSIFWLFNAKYDSVSCWIDFHYPKISVVNSNGTVLH
jgi:hypothetical protein